MKILHKMGIAHIELFRIEFDYMIQLQYCKSLALAHPHYMVATNRAVNKPSSYQARWAPFNWTRTQILAHGLVKLNQALLNALTSQLKLEIVQL